MREREKATTLLQQIPESKLYYVIDILEDVAKAERNTDPFYSKSNMEHIDRGIKALEEGNGTEHEIIEVE